MKINYAYILAGLENSKNIKNLDLQELEFYFYLYICIK